MFAIIQAAGWPIWFLLLASVVAVALIIERSISLRERKIIPPTLLDQVITVYQRQGVNEEVLQKLAKDSPLGTVLAAGLRNHRSSRSARSLPPAATRSSSRTASRSPCTTPRSASA